MNKFYPGIVEDNDDPLKIGRCKVRVVGLYDSLKKEELPWLQLSLPVNYDVIKPPKNGSQVLCMSLDEHNQTMLIHSLIPGVDDLTNTPDSPRLTRNEELDDTIVKTKSDSREQDVGESGWNEPDSTSTYGTKYPLNRVLETESGHVMEFDDTPGKERIQIYHKSGSYVEMLGDGSVIIKSVNNSYRITNGSEHVKSNSEVINTGTMTLDVDGACNIKGGSITIESHSGSIKGLRCQFTGSPNHNFS